MKSTAIFEAISDSYGKYIATIKADDSEGYLVWGEDATDDRKDKLLLDSTDNVLVFKSTTDVFLYILHSPAVLFDEENTSDWAKACLETQPLSSYTYNLESTLSLINSGRFRYLQSSAKEECQDVLNLLHLISDYAYQIDNAYLLELYRGEAVSAFSDYVYDNFFWTIPDEELSVRNRQAPWGSFYPQFIQDVTDLVYTFRSRMVYWG